MGWYSRSRRKSRRAGRATRRAWGKYTPAGRAYDSRAGKFYRKKNRKHKAVGLTPDYFVSPIDFVPYVGPASKAYRAGKYSRRTYRAVSGTAKAGYRAAKSRRGGRSKSSPKGRMKRRGKYYYYRGKRVYRR